jgi:hypothetical protein
MVGTQEHLKRAMVNRVVEGYVVFVLKIRKDLIPCAWMFGIVHPLDMNNHLVDFLYFSINLWVEESRFGQLGVHHQP